MRDQLLFLGVGVLSVAVGIPLAKRRVPRNRWYGLRIAATFASEQVWYEANAAMGRDLIALGCVVLLMALGLPLIGLGWPPAYPLTCSLVFGAGAVAAIVRGVRLANRLLRSSAEPRRPR
jgi:SdpI/YhfL family protein